LYVTGETPQAALYLDLLSQALTGILAEDSDEVLGMGNCLDALSRRKRLETRFGLLLRARGYELSRKHPFDREARENGRDWPARAETMMGLRRLENLREAVVLVLQDDVPGDLLEAGTWRGGGGILMRGVLKAHGCTNRTVWMADSFRGLPPPDAAAYPADIGLHFERHPYLAVSEEQVRANFQRYGLLDEQVRFLAGWFKDTLHQAPVDQLAVLRLDGDLYQSTMETLDALYPRLSPGGFCIIDDYGAFRACRKAVHHYRSRHDIREPIIDIDGIGVYWRRRNPSGQ
jgi:O-methyltransferase